MSGSRQAAYAAKRIMAAINLNRCLKTFFKADDALQQVKDITRSHSVGKVVDGLQELNRALQLLSSNGVSPTRALAMVSAFPMFAVMSAQEIEDFIITTSKCTDEVAVSVVMSGEVVQISDK